MLTVSNYRCKSNPNSLFVTTNVQVAKDINDITTEVLFFELMQVAIGNRHTLSRTPDIKEWSELFSICKKQTMVGIGYVGMQRLPKEQWPVNRMFIGQWMMIAEKIKGMNHALDTECKNTCQRLADEGFNSCILKGQSNSKNYGPLLGSYRTPGDIDVWVWSDSGKVRDVILYVKRISPSSKVHYHHADCHLSAKTETEVHYRPSWMSAPWRNATFQKFCDAHKSDILNHNGFAVPSLQFDAVYQLVHIYRHLFYEGIGLRQILDYYMVLQSLPATDKAATMLTIRSLGMARFASAVMYVLREVYAMPDSMSLAKANESDGKFLLKEIMLAGNFGHADERFTITREQGALRWGVKKLIRNMKFLTSYPEEVLCEPLFRIYHYLWRTIPLW